MQVDHYLGQQKQEERNKQMAKKKPQAKLLKQQAGFMPGTWELEIELERSEFNDDLTIIQMQTLIDYLMSTPLGDKIKALEAPNTVEMLHCSATYRPKTVILTAVFIVTSQQQLFALTLGEKLV